MTTTMAQIVLLSVFCIPLIVSAAFLFSALRPLMVRLAPWAALPALITSLMLPTNVVIEMPWLMLGSRFGLDETGQVFLFFTSLLWLLSGIYGSRYFSNQSIKRQALYSVFCLLAMAGNLGLIVSLDMSSFFAFYALMSFSSYGLVVYSRDGEAKRAGKFYIIFVIIGEVLLFSAIAAIADTGTTVLPHTGSLPDYVVSLVLLGFGIKIGVILLHVWIPLAYTAAPIPASAVLSGPMIKAGLLGLLRFLPLGEASLPDLGLICVIAGFAASFYGVLIGLTQKNSKTVLAYSSISQMGLMTIAIGVGLAYPQTWPLLLPTLLFYAMHHALAKSALFLGIGVVIHAGPLRHQMMLIILIPALALAGLTFTSGAGAKIALKTALESSGISWVDYVLMLLPFTAGATTLLMARFVVVLHKVESRHSHEVRGLWLPWIILIVISLVFYWFWPLSREFALASLKFEYVWAALWPIATGGVMAWGVWRYASQNQLSQRFSIPAGDVLVIYERVFSQWQKLWSAKHWIALCQRIINVSQIEHWQSIAKPLLVLLPRLETQLRQWMIAGIVFISLILALFILQVYGGGG